MTRSRLCRIVRVPDGRVEVLRYTDPDRDRFLAYLTPQRAHALGLASPYRGAHDAFDEALVALMVAPRPWTSAALPRLRAHLVGRLLDAVRLRAAAAPQTTLDSRAK